MANAYIICTTPRSGSTLLCRMLRTTGIAGAPASLFFGTSLAEWRRRMALAPSDASSTVQLRDIMAAAHALGKGDTAVFALRQQWHSFAFLQAQLALLFPAAQTDLVRLTSVFGPLRFIYLTRADKVSQAVSYLLAQQTGLWHRHADGTELERTAAPQLPTYSYEAIAAAVAKLTEWDQNWQAWFNMQGVAPFTVTYETLADAPQAQIRDILEQLNLPTQVADSVEPDVARIDDPRSREWVERFRRDGGVAP
ncbi:Stf0 family sulfotransferase [Tritonibacter scottomollicae]|uniref:Stf0 family sulfotransferase n=1 Tax=Tritonibacter scottomollicae TaxID=483013 RepID=A0ABZ0HMG6_TRISK|nr:Stf0 family sulfotransferase [Tritonibacter scottomollicae]WOI35244.1 Stf0 family sulfotransferase [Tritonibacter scottomollicae]